MQNPTITILTPTYNRREELVKLYNSLAMQSCYDFEWVVVDDGSDDDTMSWLLSLAAPFNVVPKHKDNGGKHTAINLGVIHAQGEWTVIVDSDDILVPDAVANIKTMVESVSKLNIEQSNHRHIAVVAGLCVGGNMQSLSQPILSSTTITDGVSLRSRLHIVGDLAEVYETAILRSHPFPEFNGEKFVGESWLIATIADDCDTCIFSMPIIIRNYRVDGLSANFVNLLVGSPHGTAAVYSLLAHHSKQSCRGRLLARLLYHTYLLGSCIAWRKRIADVGWISVSMLPVAVALRVYYKLTKRATPLI